MLRPVGPPRVVRPSGVGVAILTPGGVRVLFVVCQAEEWSCHIFSSDFSPCVPLSEYDHSPRVSFSGFGGLSRFARSFFSSSRGTFSLGGGTLGFNCSFIYRAVSLPTPQQFSHRLIFFRPFSASSLRVQPLGGMLSFSFLFLVEEELEYS